MPVEIVIIGGGIIGLCGAYSILESPDLPPDTRVTLIENTAVAYGASSRAAGFISLTESWHKVANRELARLSGEDWAKLAGKFNGEESFGYRSVDTATVLVSTEDPDQLDDAPVLENNGDEGLGLSLNGHSGTTDEAPPPSQWHNGEVLEIHSLPKPKMIIPNLFCSRLYQYCSQKGLRTIIGTPTGRTGKVIHVSTGEDVSYDALAITAGSWCNDVCEALSLPPVAVTGGPGHYIQIKPGYIPGGRHHIPDKVLFTGIGDTIEMAAENLAGLDMNPWFAALTPTELREGRSCTLQVFPCGDDIYIAGENNLPCTVVDYPGRPYGLPYNPRSVTDMLDQLLIDRIIRSAGCISPALDVENGARIVRASVAYRPTTPDRVPVIGQIADSVFICAGHGPWGIALAPGTGRVLSELITASLHGSEPKLSADISALSPLRFTTEQILQYHSGDKPPPIHVASACNGKTP